MYPRIVRDTAFIGEAGALVVRVPASVRCKSSDYLLSLQSGLVSPMDGSELFRRDLVSAHIGLQRGRNQNAPVRLLIVLEHRQPGTSHGKTAAIECVDEFGLSFALIAKPDIRAPRLERFEIRAGRDLAKQ